MLKLLVNDPNLWSAFKEEIEERIRKHHINIEQMYDTQRIYEEKGAIRELRDLLKLREKVNSNG